MKKLDDESLASIALTAVLVWIAVGLYSSARVFFGIILLAIICSLMLIVMLSCIRNRQRELERKMLRRKKIAVDFARWATEYDLTHNNDKED